jgi:hypothetical protein
MATRPSPSRTLGLQPVRCRARKTDGSGEQCKQWAGPGAEFCRFHTGRTPVQLQKQLARLAELLPDAVTAIGDTVRQNTHYPAKLNAAKELLDRIAGPVQRLSKEPERAININLGVAFGGGKPEPARITVAPTRITDLGDPLSQRDETDEESDA